MAFGDEYLTKSGSCKLCGVCAEACPAEARELVGRKMSLKEVIEEIRKDRLFYDESGGGVTISGGEPLMQPGFLLGLLTSCGELGIHRAVDTSGMADEQTLLKVANETDLFLYDLKHIDPQKHIEFTGVSNLMILSNLRRLADADTAISIRIPIVSGFNDDNETIHATAAFVDSLSRKCEVSLLPFHKSAKDKHWRFGMKYRLQENGEVSQARVEEILGVFTDYGLSVRIGG